MKQTIQSGSKASLLVVMMFLISISGIAQVPSSKAIAVEDNYDPIVANLDSLVNLHYIEKLNESTESGFPSSNFQGTEVPVYANDIYAKRIQKIQTEIPLTFNSQVKEYLELYAVKRRALTQRVMGLSNLYFPMYEQILDEQGLPLEFKYLSIVESALNPVAVSRMGATGLWQFMLATGRMYDLKVNSLIDERRDPVKSTYAACAYFKDMYAIYNDWLLVIAAYNCGAGNVNKAIARSGGKRTFWEISAYLPKETRGYVPAFIAVTYLLNYSAEHNLVPIAPKLTYFETDTILVDQKVTLREIAAAVGMSLEDLTYLNPVYKRGIIPESEEALELRLPSSKINTYLANVDQIYKKSELDVVPFLASEIKEETKSSASVSGLVKKKHHIRSGEHLQSIANRYRCSVNDLKRWNNLNSSRLIAGNYLTVYVKGAKKTIATSTEPKSAKSNNSTSSVQPRSNGESKQADAITSSQNPRIVYHVVEPGDTLWDIAKRYDGVTVQQIKDANRLSSNNLVVGTKLKVLIGG